MEEFIMSQSIVVSQGATFVVELQSMLGSSNYGWCLSSLPKGVVLLGIDTVPSPRFIGPVNQKFYFGACSCDQTLTLEFVVTASHYLQDIKDTYTVDVQIVPADKQQFVPYSENTIANVKYGYACADQDQMPIGKYGYPYEDQMPVVKYGYPCADQMPVVKYGYPCADQMPVVKYGYPCADQTPVMKYGYPDQPPVMKYGYPCGYNDAAGQVNQPFLRNSCTPDNQPFLRNSCAPDNQPFLRNSCAPDNQPFLRNTCGTDNQPFLRNSCAPTDQPFLRNDSDAMKTAMPYGMVYVTNSVEKYGFPYCG